MFGRTDTDASKGYLDFAESVATDFADPTGAMAAKMRTGFEAAAGNLPIESLVEFFSKPNVGPNLLIGAKALENACFASSLRHPSKLDSTEAKIILGIISDYAGMRRKDVLGAQASSEDKTSLGLEKGKQESLL